MKVESTTGQEVTFDFPAAASGQEITLTPDTARSIGWPEGQFGEVIKLEPDGSTFAEPIVVRPTSGDIIVLTFPSGTTKTKPEALPLNDTRDGFLLSHFSTLAVVPPERSCGSVSGWEIGTDDESEATCTDPDYPRYLKLGCNAYAYCLRIEAHCCAAENATACKLDDQQLFISFEASDDTRDGAYAYCSTAVPDDGGAGAGGAPVAGSTGSAGSTPEAGAGAGGAGEGGAGAGGAPVAGSTGSAGSTPEAGAGAGGAGAGAGAGGSPDPGDDDAGIPGGGGAGGSSGSAGGGGSGSIACGGLLCSPDPIWAEIHPNVAVTCCTEQDECGQRSNDVCVARRPNGSPDQSCATGEFETGPGSQPVDGCCTPQGQCGLDYSFFGFGCLPRQLATTELGGELPPLSCNPNPDQVDPSEDDAGVPAGGFCQPFVERPCYCAPTVHGSQICNSFGTTYGRCSCYDTQPGEDDAGTPPSPP